MTAKASYGGARELVLKRIIGAPREALFRAWTEADLLKQWFAPKPWAIVEARLDIRTGGSNRFVMKSPEGKEFPNCGVSLAVVPNEKTVLANVYVEARVLSEKSFFTASSAFEDIGGSEAKCVARARHWTTEDRKTHEKRGFHEAVANAPTSLPRSPRSSQPHSDERKRHASWKTEDRAVPVV